MNSIWIMILVFLFKWLDNKSIVDLIFDIAGYTYGPLLGLFAFGIEGIILGPIIISITSILLRYLKEFYEIKYDENGEIIN